MARVLYAFSKLITKCRTAPLCEEMGAKPFSVTPSAWSRRSVGRNALASTISDNHASEDPGYQPTSPAHSSASCIISQANGNFVLTYS